jgi:hypothetical protein
MYWDGFAPFQDGGGEFASERIPEPVLVPLVLDQALAIYILLGNKVSGG